LGDLGPPVPILLAAAGKGLVEDKRAIACIDLTTAITRPNDMAEELDKGTDYTQLMFSHLNYKAALLTPGVMQELFGIVLLPIPKSTVESFLVFFSCILTSMIACPRECPREHHNKKAEDLVCPNLPLRCHILNMITRCF